MPFDRPTLSDLVIQSQGDLETRLNDGAPVLPVSNLAVIARVLAAGIHGLYGYLDWQSDQLLPDTAEAEYLERHAAIHGLYRLAATYASGTLTVQGTSGTVIPAGTRWRRADGPDYAATADVTLSGTTAAVPVQARGAGDAGDTPAGVTLTLAIPIVGLQAQATVASPGLTGGAEQESDERLRARLLARIQSPPQGGCASDYVAWTYAAHPDVTRAWVDAAQSEAGRVVVRMMTDGATPNGIPSATVVDAVAAYIEDRRPVTARPIVVAPVALPLAVTLAVAPNTAAVRAAVAQSIADLLLAEAVPSTDLPLSHLRAAISAAPGEFDYALSSPTANVAVPIGSILVPGTITWV